MREKEAIILGAEIAAGHDGAADLVLQVRFQNGVEGPVVLDLETAVQLMNACGVASIDKLAGHPWRKVLEDK